MDNMPNNLSEAIVYVLSHNSEADLRTWAEKPERQAIGSIHFFGGMSLRNDLELWHKNALTKWFNGKGITHADDMSGIILTSVHRTIKRIDLDLDGQVKVYQDFWKCHGVPNGIPDMEEG